MGCSGSKGKKKNNNKVEPMDDEEVGADEEVRIL